MAITVGWVVVVGVMWGTQVLEGSLPHLVMGSSQWTGIQHELLCSLATQKNLNSIC